MKNIYQRINGADWCNIWVVGDLHGCHRLLMNALAAARFDAAQDLLISVGDLTDRGSESVKCLELITMPWFRAVCGNHEQMMLAGLAGNTNLWFINGGDWFFNLDDDQQQQVRAMADKIADLPLIIELVTRDRKYVICHADYPHDEYEFDKPVNTQLVVWSRERLSRSMNGDLSEIAGADLFIFGHTPVRKPLSYANQLYIDTGAVFGGELTLRQLQGKVDG